MSGGGDTDRTASLHSPVRKKEAPEVRVRVGALTDPGLVRSNNEDSHVVTDLSVPPAPPPPAPPAAEAPETSPPEPAGSARPGGPADAPVPAAEEPIPPTDTSPYAGGVLGRKGILLAVSDGMGGHSAGEVASRLAVKHLSEELLAEWAARPERDAVAELRNDLKVSVDRANRAVLAHAALNPDRDGMGATLTAAVIAGTRMVLAHVGDSRCYLLREGFLKCLTSDQSLAEELVRRGIVERGSPAYLARRSVLTRVIGQKGPLEPDLDVVDLARGDRLLLCSDGLYGPVPEDSILEILDESETPGEAVAALVAKARERGAPDNVTCVTAWLDGEGLPRPSERDAGGGTVSVAIDSVLTAAEDATLALASEKTDDTGEFAPSEIAADDTLAGTVVPLPPPGPPAGESPRGAAPSPSSAPRAVRSVPPSPEGGPSPPVHPAPVPPPACPPPDPPRRRDLPTPVLVVLVLLAFVLVVLALVDF